MKLKVLVGTAVFVIATPVGLAAAQVVETDPALVQQVPTIPPTFPCPGCGPSGTIGDGSRIWGFAQHHCPPGTTAATYSLTYGVGSGYPNPVRFFARTGEQTGFARELPDVELRTINPGDEFTDYPVLTVPPGASVEVTAFGIDTVTGERPQFYDGTTEKMRLLTCPCEGPVPTTPAAGGGGGTGPTPSVTVPPDIGTGTAITIGRPRVPPSKLTSPVPAGTLPATGASTAFTLAGIATLVVCLGITLHRWPKCWRTA